MNDNIHCGDPEVLVGYLYDESDPAEREAIAAHIACCPSCADEIESLRSTRAALAAWTPAETALGFRITRDEPAAARVLRPAVWWRQPLPAWAQAAAALLVFVAGWTFGNARQPAVVPPAVATLPAAAPATARGTDASAAVAVSHDDLARLEQRLRAVETARVQTASARPSSGGDAALLRQVEALIASSEERQNATMSEIATGLRRLDLQQRVDVRQFEDRLGRIHDATRVELGRQNDALSYVIQRASFTSGAGR